MAALDKIRGAVNRVANAVKPAPTPDRLAELEDAARVAALVAAKARDALAATYHDGAQSGEFAAVDAAEHALQDAEAVQRRADATLAAYRKIAAQRAAAERGKLERATWNAAYATAEARIAVARELVAILERAGELYRALQDSGTEVYQAMPRKPQSIGGMLLDQTTCEIGVALELARFGLPSKITIGPSQLLDQPRLVDRVTDAAKLVRTVDGAAIDREDDIAASIAAGTTARVST